MKISADMANMQPSRRHSRRKSLFAVFALGLLTLSLAALHVDAAVMAIDYGAQWFKVSLVKPGVPLEIVLNRESKRKTRSIVALRDGKRAFDTEAVNLVCTLKRSMVDQRQSGEIDLGFSRPSFDVLRSPSVLRCERPRDSRKLPSTA